MRHTKIVATLGPASSNKRTLSRLVSAGVDVFRLNFSHGTAAEHLKTLRLIRKVCASHGTDAAVLQDLCGPKIRVGAMANDAVELLPRTRVVITPAPVLGTAARFGTNYRRLAGDVRKGARVLLDDGAMELTVERVSGREVLCRVIRGGTLESHKGMNLPGTTVSEPSVTRKDLADLKLGIREKVDFVALSFVRHPDDVRHVRSLLAARGSRAQVIAKIEKPEAIHRVEDIVAASDGILVARGDLGVEMDLAQVPVLQKEIVRMANEQGKYVIVATQMLESMMRSRLPTRAEVSDVTNAIIDGADAVMLSGETAVGSFPVEAVKMMDRIAHRTEAYLRTHPPSWNWPRVNPVHPMQDAIGRAAFGLCADLRASAIVAFSASGGTALFVSKSRPFVPILAFTSRPDAFRRMRLFWGVQPVLDAQVRSKVELIERGRLHLLKLGLARKGDMMVVVAGSHFGHVGSTNGIELASVY